MSTFRDRLDQILAGRAISTWAEGLGISGSTLQRMAKGTPPAAELLTAVARVENVSLTWLLEGRGRPFLINHCETDQEAAALYVQFLQDEPGWLVHLVSDGSRLVIVLTQPGSFTRGKSATIHYQLVEVITGVAGPLTQQAVERLQGAVSGPLVCRVTPEQLAELTRGEIGTWRLIGNARTPGLLSGAKKTALQDLFDELEVTPVYLNRNDRVVLSHFHAMEPSDKERYKKIGASLSEPVATSGRAASNTNGED